MLGGLGAMPLASLEDRQQFVSEDELTSLYGWLDEIPLSRLKRNIYRDFADVSHAFAFTLSFPCPSFRLVACVLVRVVGRACRLSLQARDGWHTSF